VSCKDLFALGVRLIGIWLITRGIMYVEGFADVKLYPASDRARDGAAGNLIYAALDFGLAAFFLLWTRVIVAWTYSSVPGSDKEQEGEIENGTGGHSNDAVGAS
jgi:hypothetical protein